LAKVRRELKLQDLQNELKPALKRADDALYEAIKKITKV